MSKPVGNGLQGTVILLVLIFAYDDTIFMISNHH